MKFKGRNERRRDRRGDGEKKGQSRKVVGKTRESQGEEGYSTTSDEVQATVSEKGGKKGSGDPMKNFLRPTRL
jgi:hypothetical protein